MFWTDVPNSTRLQFKFEAVLATYIEPWSYSDILKYWQGVGNASQCSTVDGRNPANQLIW